MKDNILFDIMKKMEEFETKNKDEIELIKMVNKVPKDELLKEVSKFLPFCETNRSKIKKVELSNAELNCKRGLKYL